MDEKQKRENDLCKAYQARCVKCGIIISYSEFEFGGGWCKRCDPIYYYDQVVKKMKKKV